MNEIILLKAFDLDGLTQIEPGLSSIRVEKKLSRHTVHITYSDTGETERKYYRGYPGEYETLRIFEITKIIKAENT